MSRAIITIDGSGDRSRAVNWINKAPPGTRVEFKAPARSLDQNSLLWQRLTEVSTQVVWHGQRLKPSDWKDIFTAALRKARVVPGIDPGSFVLLGLHTSDMSKEEMGNLLDLIDAFGAEHGVTFRDVQPSELEQV
jgi:NinB protein